MSFGDRGLGGGELVTHAQDIADAGSGAYVATEFKVEDLKVTVHDRTARWQCIASHLTKIAGP